MVQQNRDFLTESFTTFVPVLKISMVVDKSAVTLLDHLPTANSAVWIGVRLHGAGK
jgi:hypothetical protein